MPKPNPLPVPIPGAGGDSLAFLKEVFSSFGASSFVTEIYSID